MILSGIHWISIENDIVKVEIIRTKNWLNIFRWWNNLNWKRCEKGIFGSMQLHSVFYQLYLSNTNRLWAQLAAILRIFNSSQLVKTADLGKLCKDTYLLVLYSFPWASITPTLHKLLAHSKELIWETNSGYGLKCFSEEGTESCNKLIRKYRGNLSR